MDPMSLGSSIFAGIPTHGTKLLDWLGKVKGELTTLKSLSRKDLLSSISQLNIGITTLNLAESSNPTELQKQERLKSAEQSFVQATKEANKAFNDESLKIEEKITACWICIVSSVHQHFNDSEAAGNESMLHLKNLNTLPEVGKLFSNSQPKFYKDARVKNVDNVLMINLSVADFIAKHTCQRKVVLDWPLIQFGEHKFHPLYFKYVEDITTASIPWCAYHFCTDEVEVFFNKEIILTNEGELLTFSGNNLQKLDSETGKLQPWCKEKWEIDDWQVRCMTVDNNGVVYVLSGYGGKHVWTYQLTVFSENDAIQQSTLKFLDNIYARNLFMAVTNDEVIAIAFVEGDQPNINLCVCYKTGSPVLTPCRIIGIHNPLVDELKCLSFSADREIALITYRHKYKHYRLLFYSMEAKLLKHVIFKPSTGEIRVYNQVIYTTVTNTITGFYLNNAGSKLVIETFSAETKKLQWTLTLMNTGYYSEMFSDSARVVHHVNGMVAFVTKNRIVYIDKKMTHRNL
ncbi:uncharacterized protein LOC124438594 [Xenia sp. Carnegie-2017]|uniref:uncharacterized protein LOC124438594 n=1 Tax=Xenia sp. Carnegie-2017 TaxID=2897299 RepID=UPI001F037709|nr:uncharacterized protein LOC124438594 [Xenia sp. Carnegie-2017]XP_046844721.1 uncharacterized protein LOC124438594 [Xenia sp. Carnegie-2017]XP_046844722.1 uncharacterized protein LOC124438594 [Xenia sp. Carnegie-2017]